MAQQKFTGKASLAFAEKMMAALTKEKMTRADMEAKLYISKTKALNYIRFLHGDEGDTKRIYICGYEVRENGGRNPIYSAGNHFDAEPPGKLSSAEYFKRRKDSPEKHARYLAKLRVAALAKRCQIKPQNIFSPLGL